MKKILSMVIICVFLLSCPVCAEDAKMIVENSSFPVYVDNQKVDFEDTPNLVINGIQVVPVSFLSEYLGYTVENHGGLIHIKESETCKNKQGMTEIFLINLKTDTSIYYESKLGSKESIEMIDEIPIYYRINEEIYLSPYYFCQVLDLKMSGGFAGEKISIYTRDYLLENTTDNKKTIFITNTNGIISINYEGSFCYFTAKPFIDEEGRTQVPVREFCEWLDNDVIWLEETQTVSISSVPISLKQTSLHAGGSSVWFKIGEKQYRINGNYYEMDTVAKIINDRTYVPIRYLAEALGYEIEYNAIS